MRSKLHEALFTNSAVVFQGDLRSARRDLECGGMTPLWMVAECGAVAGTRLGFRNTSPELRAHGISDLHALGGNTVGSTARASESRMDYGASRETVGIANEPTSATDRRFLGKPACDEAKERNQTNGKKEAVANSGFLRDSVR